MSTLAQTLAKARRYCAIQERCHQEVRDKLYAWELHREQVEQVIGQLIGDGYLNEQRFAEHYAVSKFRQKGWGRKKILAGLKAKRISGPCIIQGLRSIDQAEYMAVLRKVLSKYGAKQKGFTQRERQLRTKRHALARGFEADLIDRALKDQ